MDDLLIHSSDPAIHKECTWKILQHLQEHKIYLKLEKCTFAASEVEYLGMVVGKDGIQMDPTKLKAIREWTPPVSVKDVHSFLEFCNFYQKFIPSFSDIA